MIIEFYNRLSSTSPVSAVIIAVSLMLFCGLAATRITRLLHLPNVTAYIVTGIIIGPYCINLIPQNIIAGMDFISDIALAFIAFSAGEFFRIPTLRENGGKVVIITLLESLLASLLIFILTFFVLKLGLAFSVILAALASATAPASTMMTIRQTGAKGDFVDTLLSVVALDDVVSLVAFSIAVSLAIASMGGALTCMTVLKPIILNILMVVVGAVLGFLLKILMFDNSKDNRLIVTIALLFAICGLGAAIGVSPLLGCMTIGMVYINITNDEILFKQINYFAPPILLLFFVKSGLNFRMDAILDTKSAVAGVPLLLIGILYFLVRIVGKYAGAFIGCHFAGKSHLVRNYLGMALIPQAGVSIGLAALGARLLGGETGSILQTIILSSSILYELIGPGCAKASLYLSKSYEPDGAEEQPEPEDAAKAEEVAELKERFLAIQEQLRQTSYSRSEEEQAFNNAAAYNGEDEAYLVEYMRRFGRRNRRRR